MAVDTFSRVTKLIGEFPACVDIFRKENPFNKSEQLSRHLATLDMRNKAGSASAAISNDDFLDSLYQTLQAWGIGMRASKLKPLGSFCDAIRSLESEISELDDLNLNNRTHKPAELANQLWRLISCLNIVENDTPLVSGTKTLHHILPKLVVPVDRAYTQSFFGWQNPDFQYGQSKVFATSFKAFVRIAHAVDLEQYLDDGWCSSTTKVIDNAVVGFVQRQKLGI